MCLKIALQCSNNCLMSFAIKLYSKHISINAFSTNQLETLFGCKNKVRHSQYQSYAKLWPKCGQHVGTLEEAILFWGSLHWHLEGQPLNSFFLKVTYFVSQHRKWPSRTFVDFVLEKMELARVVDWFAWLEISWRIWRKEKACQGCRTQTINKK